MKKAIVLETVIHNVFNEKPYPSRLGVVAIAESRGVIKAGYSDIRGDGMPIGLP